MTALPHCASFFFSYDTHTQIASVINTKRTWSRAVAVVATMAVSAAMFTALPGCKQEVQQITTQLSIWTLIHMGNPKPQTGWGCTTQTSN